MSNLIDGTRVHYTDAARAAFLNKPDHGVVTDYKYRAARERNVGYVRVLRDGHVIASRYDPKFWEPCDCEVGK